MDTELNSNKKSIGTGQIKLQNRVLVFDNNLDNFSFVLIYQVFWSYESIYLFAFELFYFQTNEQILISLQGTCWFAG